MLVTCVVFVAIVRTARSFARIREHMLVYVVTMNMMKMAVMKVVDVVAVLNCCVSAVCSVSVSVIAVNCTIHLFSPEWK